MPKHRYDLPERHANQHFMKPVRWLLTSDVFPLKRRVFVHERMARRHQEDVQFAQNVVVTLQRQEFVNGAWADADGPVAAAA